MTRRMTAGLLIALALSVAACSDDSNRVSAPSFDTAVPALEASSTTRPATEAPASTVASSATSAPATSSPSSAPTVSEPTVSESTVFDPTASEPTPPATVDSTQPDANGVTGPMFSDALGVKVATAPGVNTPGDTRQLLPAGLYVHIAWQADPTDASVFTVQPDDIPILEAYANAVTTYYRAATTTLTTDDPAFDRYYVDGGAKYDDSFAEAQDGGYTLSLGAGVVLRPYVLADQRDEVSAVVLDCYLQDEQYVLAGTEPVLEPTWNRKRPSQRWSSRRSWIGKIAVDGGTARIV